MLRDCHTLEQGPLPWLQRVIDEPVLAVFREGCEVGAVALRESVEVGAVEFHRERLLLAAIALIRGEVHSVVVDGIDAENFIVTFLELAFEFGVSRDGILLVKTIEVEVSAAVAPTGPDKPVFGLQNVE